MRQMTFLVAILTGFLRLSASASAQEPLTGELRGTVRDAATREPVANAVIVVDGARVPANQSGVFVVSLATGEHTIQVSAPGYMRSSPRRSCRRADSNCSTCSFRVDWGKKSS